MHRNNINLGQSSNPDQCSLDNGKRPVETPVSAFTDIDQPSWRQQCGYIRLSIMLSQYSSVFNKVLSIVAMQNKPIGA